MIHAVASRACLLALLLLAGSRGFAQQIPCPINSNYTNTSTASNQVNCDIFANLDNATPAVLNNLNGGMFNIYGTLTNAGRLDNQAGAWINNNFGGDLTNGGYLINDSQIANSGMIDNNTGGTFDNSGATTNYAFLNNGGYLINRGSGVVTSYIGPLQIGPVVNNSGQIDNYGTFATDPNTNLYNSGGFNNYGYLNHDGQFFNESGATLNNYGAVGSLEYTYPPRSTDNSGTINNFGNFHDDAFINESGSLLNNQAGASFDGSGIDNSGVIDDSGTLTVFGRINNFGLLRIEAGGEFHTGDQSDLDDIPVENFGTIELYGRFDNGDCAALHNSATVLIAKGGSMIFSTGSYYQSSGVTTVDGTFNGSAYIQEGKVKGTGSIVGGVSMYGTMAPGDSSGALTIGGAYGQDRYGTFELEIFSSGFDQLNVGGLVSLDGTLDIVLAQGFDPAVGTTYKFLLFNPGELSGVFATIQNDYFNNNTEKWIVVYDNAHGFVEVEAAPVPEPASLLLLGSGLLTLGYGVRRRLKR